MLSGTMGVVGVGKKMKGVAALGVISVEDREGGSCKVWTDESVISSMKFALWFDLMGTVPCRGIALQFGLNYSFLYVIIRL